MTILGGDRQNAGMRGRASVTPARFSLVGMIDDAETDRGALALAVWIYSAVWGLSLIHI